MTEKNSTGRKFHWKNTDDNLLKYLICKYGFNKWFKISTLLPNKSFQECKFRWINWLDFKIKKKKWTVSEDIKLVNLTKKFSSQFNFLGDLLKRNSFQILYRLLLLKKIKKFILLNGFRELKKKFKNFSKKDNSFLSKFSSRKNIHKNFLSTKFRIINQRGKKILKTNQSTKQKNKKINELDPEQIIEYINIKKKRPGKNRYHEGSHRELFFFFIYKKIYEARRKWKLRKTWVKIQKKGSVLHTLYNRMVFFPRNQSDPKFI
jgi:hypothetical protein